LESKTAAFSLLSAFRAEAAARSARSRALRRWPPFLNILADSIAAFEADIAARKAQMSGIAEDQLRVRENMKALKGSSEEKALAERYARELNDQEDRVQSLQREISDLREKRDVTQKGLTEMIENLELEATL
jgi:chromosome segregation ATPase